MLGVVDGRKLTIAPSLQGGKHRITNRESTGGHEEVAEMSIGTETKHGFQRVEGSVAQWEATAGHPAEGV
jgi:hypothetical protein